MLTEKLDLIQQKLSISFEGEFSTDVLQRQLYASAACIYEALPLAIAVPKNSADLRLLLDTCHELNLPVLPRGAGSSLSGGTVNRAVVVDMSRHFKKMEWVNDTQVRVEAGVVFDDLQKFCAARGRRIGPDPSSGAYCTVGGMLANNAGGPHSLQHGNISEHVFEMKLHSLTSAGSFTAGKLRSHEIDMLSDPERAIYRPLFDDIANAREIIDEEWPAIRKNASGYNVKQAIENKTVTNSKAEIGDETEVKAEGETGIIDSADELILNLPALLCGSEGTLVLIENAVLQTLPIKSCRSLLVLKLDSLEKLSPLLTFLIEKDAATIEFVDSSFIKFALQMKPELAQAFPADARMLLFVEFEAADHKSLNSATVGINSEIERENWAEPSFISSEQAEIEKIMKLRRSASAILHQVRSSGKPLSFIEDAAIEPGIFSEFLVKVDQLIGGKGLEFVMFGHAGNGNLHIRPLMDMKDPQQRETAYDIMTEFVKLVKDYGGTLSGEHGDGRLRTPFLPDMYPRTMPLFRRIKAIFDPSFLLNPGVIVPAERDPDWLKGLRYEDGYPYSVLPPLLNAQKWIDELQLCHGCGACRGYCPVFQATGKEEASGRSKANLLRGILRGDLPENSLQDPALLTVMELCVNCGQCTTDCPTLVDIPALSSLAKNILHRYIPYKRSEKLLQNGKILNELGSMTRPFSNIFINDALFRRILEKTSGIHRKRILPKFERSKVEDSVFRFSGYRSHKQVVLWSGCAANYNDSRGEQAHAQQLLEKMDYEVIHPEWRCCNVAALSHGNIDGSRDDLQFNVRTLLPFAENGIPIVFTSASCGYAFQKEYAKFYPDLPELAKITEMCFDIHEFVADKWTEIAAAGKLQAVNLKIVYHNPCHLKAQKNVHGPLQLLSDIPKLEIVPISDSCCGIAGTFGMKKQYFDLSMHMGDPLFNEIGKAEPQLTVSGCSTCQIQIRQGSGVQTIHPVILLNRAFPFSE